LHTVRRFAIEINREICDRKHLAHAMRIVVVAIAMTVASDIALTFP
jgi:hypothetical protein